ncbi:isoprenyl transferase [Halanaerobium salsuginis]|jgi:undecaprenyl diphosphate synthase|uniref:Isoprenyl transferase n=1 Tax=Halanaerobium salsuginis TaxID=29563 RepID=A0A1I4F965_9FIRM|nr:isoprenyl transferase [Halanaerobium salsuginis]SFL14508.1 Undecaprenyl pyrophosphate synthetase [Halanaerobium salsuginis]
MYLPKHVAIIMDGNGRWAQQKQLPRREGHKAGVKTLKKIVKYAAQIELKMLTVYAFSTENWKRPQAEVSFLLALMRRTLQEEVSDLLANNVKVNFVGRKNALTKKLIDEIEEIEAKSSSNDGLTLNIAFNYGGRAEIIDAVKQISADSQAGKISAEQIDEITFAKYLYNSDLKEVELMIRTGGDQRLSNFLLWQSAYAELYFTEKFWPDFTENDFNQAIIDFRARERRFGGLNASDNHA